MKDQSQISYSKSPDVSTKIIDHTTYLLKKGDKYVRRLNQTASLIWQNLGESKTADELVTIVRNFYSVPKTQIIQDVQKFLSVYLKEGFINQTP